MVVGGTANSENESTILTSPDGITWTRRVSRPSYPLRDVAWNGSEFVTVGEIGAILYSGPDNDADGLADALDPDDDNDGMTDTFELANSFDPFNPADADLDADLDGFTNLEEFQAGTDPHDSDSKPTNDIVVNLPSGVTVLFNNNSSSVLLHGDTAETLAVADVDNNGIDDVIVSFPAGSGPDSNGGTYISRNQDPLTLLDTRTAEQIVVGDFDGGGQTDLLLDFGTDGLWVALNDTAAVLLTPLSPITLATGDIDNNGQDDMALSFDGIGTLSLINFGPVIFYDSSVAEALEIADVDNNGEGDVIASFPAGSGPGGAGGIYFARNQGALNFFADSPAEQIVGGDFDGNGQTDLLFDLGIDGMWAWGNDTSASLITLPSPRAIARVISTTTIRTTSCYPSMVLVLSD